MSACSGLPTTMDLCGIAAIHSLWIVSLAGILAEVLLLFPRSARWRSKIGLLLLTSTVILTVGVFVALQSGQLSNWPIWSGRQIFGLTYASWIGAFILAGIMIRSLQLGASLAFVSFLRRTSFEAPPVHWGDIQGKTAKAEVRITSTRWLQHPVTIGWWRPLILIPGHFAVRLSADQARILVAHESCHIENRDFVWNLLQSLAELILFYHPATWLLSWRIRMEREFACDDRVISSGTNPIDYAKVLAFLESSRGVLQPLLMASNGAPLLLRIQRVLGRGEKKYLSLVRLSFIMLCAVTGGIASSGVASSGSELDSRLDWEQRMQDEQLPTPEVFSTYCCPAG